MRLVTHPKVTQGSIPSSFQLKETSGQWSGIRDQFHAQRVGNAGGGPGTLSILNEKWQR
jgi:hypothetical protein